MLTDPVDILLVEDNASDEKLTLRVLRKHQLANRVHVVRDGADALDFIFGEGAYRGRDLSNPPKVILLDIKLPKVDGLEVLRRIRADSRTSQQPVVLLTSSAERQDIEAAYQHHANSYIVKPVAFDDFSAAISNLGFYWLILNRAPAIVDLKVAVDQPNG